MLRTVLLLTLIMLLFPAAPAQAQADFPPPEPITAYTIAVTLDADQRRLTASETITYRNTSAVAIPDLVFHLYLNAFRDETTIFMQESGGLHRAQGWNPLNNGWIELESLRLADGPELAVELLEDGTLARAVLPAPLAPGEEIRLEAGFQAQLPQVFARTGWALDAAGQPFFMVGQWFPKLGVWQGEQGWNAYPFHANSEFFADFGSYDVTITLPAGWVTGATGLPVDAAAAGLPNASAGEAGPGATQTARYQAENVIDFAWTASPNFLTAARALELPGGDIEILYLYLPEHAWSVERALDATEQSMVLYSEWYGHYPYPRLTVVDVPDTGQGAGGMEYPTLITAGVFNLLGLATQLPGNVERGLELVIVHEAGHQWFQSLVATNEAEEPWLDEGFTDYSTMRALSAMFDPRTSAIDLGGLDLGYLDVRRLEYLTNPNVPMYGRAWDYPGVLDYGVAAYSKPALSLLTLENVLGEETMLQVMRAYTQRYAYRHPTTADFRQVAEEVSGENLDWFFDGLVYGSSSLNYRAARLEQHALVAERVGDVTVPVEVALWFDGGERRVVTWEGQETPHTFAYPNDPPLLRAEIDPQRKVLVDTVWSDNAITRQRDFASWLAVFGRLVYSLQDLILMLGGL